MDQKSFTYKKLDDKINQLAANMNKSIGEINKNIEALMKMIVGRDNKRGIEIIELANKLSIHAYMTDDSSQLGLSKYKVNKQ